MVKQWVGQTATCAALLFSALVALPVNGQRSEPQLWVSDDAAHRLYRVGVDGTLLGQYTLSLTGNTTFTIPPSDVSAGAGKSLWVVVERPGRLARFNHRGAQQGPSLLTEPFGAVGPEGVAFDPTDDTLWVVDDPDPANAVVTRVYQIDLSGTLLARFETRAYAAAATSPQAIAVDPRSGTLWITDNSADRVYNVSRRGVLLRSFPRTAFDAAATNLQGVAVANDGTLWLSDRHTGRLYNVNVDGALLSSFPCRRYAAGACNPTGIVFEPASGFFVDNFEVRRGDAASGQ